MRKKYNTPQDVYKRQPGLYHVLLLICNRELLFIGKRKDEDDMAKSTKTYEERIRELEQKEQESIEAVSYTHLDVYKRQVKNHISSIFKKLEVTDRTQAAVFAIRNNIIQIM